MKHECIISSSCFPLLSSMIAQVMPTKCCTTFVLTFSLVSTDFVFAGVDCPSSFEAQVIRRVVHALGRELLPVVTSSPFSSVKASNQLM